MENGHCNMFTLNRFMPLASFAPDSLPLTSLETCVNMAEEPLRERYTKRNENQNP